LTTCKKSIASRVKSKEQRVESREQRAEGGEPGAGLQDVVKVFVVGLPGRL
jgi:hypothetical protein